MLFDMSLFLSGQSFFQEYLHRIGQTPSPVCLYCNHLKDMTEHTMFGCPEWTHLCQPVKFLGGKEFSPNDVEDLLCTPVDILTFTDDPLQTQLEDAAVWVRQVRYGGDYYELEREGQEGEKIQRKWPHIFLFAFRGRLVQSPGREDNWLSVKSRPARHGYLVAKSILEVSRARRSGVRARLVMNVTFETGPLSGNIFFFIKARSLERAHLCIL